MKVWHVMALLSCSVFYALALYAQDPEPWKYVDFDVSMRLAEYPRSIGTTKRIVGIDGQELYDFFKDLYNKYNLTALRNRGIHMEEKIPRIIHQIWIGGPLPEAFEELCESWKFYHMSRGWFYKLWTDEDAAKMKLHNRKFFDETDSPGVKSDIMKWEIVYNFGGFYLDVDFECLKPLDPLLVYDFVTAIQPLDGFFVQLGAALYGARPYHPILEHCINAIKDDWHHKGAPTKTGPVHYTKSFFAMAGKDGSIDMALPVNYAYPLGAQEKNYQYEKWVNEGAYAIHHWAKSWMPARYRLEQFQKLDNDTATEGWND